MLSESDDDYKEAVLASLDKLSTEIDQDLDVQSLNSKSDLHNEELCGWAVSQSDINRFRWNLQRKVLKTPTKDSKLTRRTNLRSDIEFEFKHYRHLTNYMEQYRNSKTQKFDGLLLDTKTSEMCDQCCKNSNCESYKSKSPSISVGITTPTKPLSLFRGSLYGSRAFQSTSASIPENSVIYNHSGKQAIDSNNESWAVIGVEKRPLPPQTKPRLDIRTRQRQKINVNKSNSTVKSRDHDFRTSSTLRGLRGTARSNSAPNIGTSVTRQWQNERKTESSIAEVDYSSYTEMFKNVLEYYGTKKLKPRKKPGSAGNVRILSIKS